MPEHIVLIPFYTANSDEHIRSIKGGHAPFQKEDKVQQAKAKLEDLDIKIAKLQSTGNVPEELIRARAMAHEYAEKGLAKRKGWRKVKADDIVCLDSLDLAGALNRLHEADDVLYIRGHCEPGSKALQSSDYMQTIGVADLVAKLEGKLDKQFSGRIKIFACNSATDGTGQSFAYQFADKLADAGWVKARVIGYSSELSTFISDPRGYKTAEGGGRARDAQVEVRAPTSCAIL